MKKWIISKKKYLFLFFIAIAIHWLILFLAFTIQSKTSGSTDSFFEFFYKCYIECGDTPHYLYLAEYGYPTFGENINLIVFFPLYPLLIKLLSFIVQDYFISGIIISNICMGISVCLLYYLAKLELGEESKAVDSVYAYLLYPFSVFLIGVFTESLFIMLSLLCLIFIKKKKWLLVGITGLLCALTRMQGVVFIASALYVIITTIIKEKKFDKRYLYVFITLLGFVIYLILNKAITGDFFSFLHYQKIEPWYNYPNWITANLTQHYEMAFEHPGLSYIIYWAQLILFFISILLLFFGLKRKVSKYLIVYGVGYLAVTYLQGWMISGPRYVLSCVPLYIIFATIKNQYLKNILLVMLGILTMFYTLCFLAGHAIM